MRDDPESFPRARLARWWWVNGARAGVCVQTVRSAFAEYCKDTTDTFERGVYGVHFENKLAERKSACNPWK